ncbi:phosphotransferase family protein [Streptacidiphilus sp. N1-10]|uniref:Phosphotransferase family protein n=1 Tax=Streptacidiphilus jeojiensis TaxID=3229225 RepID=A0ABV6XG81_9ACTN
MTVRQVDDDLLAALREQVDAHTAARHRGSRVRDLRPLTGGTSSLTFTVELEGVPRAETPMVLKVAPPGLPPVRNRDVLRQARLQKALQAAERTLAPNVFFSDPGIPPEVPPFMAMNLVTGECVEPVLQPQGERPEPGQVHARFLDAARLLAALHRVVPEAVGLGAEPVVGLDEEIDRWTRAFDTLPAELSGDYRRVAAALHATVPAALTPVINHGDFRLGNAFCADGRINAVIDWEIWSVGDPRVDVSWLAFFTDDAGHPAADPGPAAGTPTGADVVRAYQAEIGRTLPDLDWFHALTRYKESGLTGLLIKRADKSGRQLTGAMARMRPGLPVLLDQAMHYLGH